MTREQHIVVLHLPPHRPQLKKGEPGREQDVSGETIESVVDHMLDCKNIGHPIHWSDNSRIFSAAGRSVWLWSLESHAEAYAVVSEEYQAEAG